MNNLVNYEDNKKLSYYHTRSIFSISERYKQTLKSISTIYSKIPNVKILFLECSNLNEYKEYEQKIAKMEKYILKNKMPRYNLGIC